MPTSDRNLAHAVSLDAAYVADNVTPTPWESFKAGAGVGWDSTLPAEAAETAVSMHDESPAIGLDSAKNMGLAPSEWFDGITHFQAKRLIEGRDKDANAAFFGQNSGWNLLGTIIGAVADPSNFIPFIPSAKAAVVTAKLGKVAGTAAVIGAESGIAETLAQPFAQYNRPDGSFADGARMVALATGVGAVFGGAVSALTLTKGIALANRQMIDGEPVDVKALFESMGVDTTNIDFRAMKPYRPDPGPVRPPRGESQIESIHAQEIEGLRMEIENMKVDGVLPPEVEDMLTTAMKGLPEEDSPEMIKDILTCLSQGVA